jgi:hypothetical protein
VEVKKKLRADEAKFIGPLYRISQRLGVEA